MNNKNSPKLNIKQLAIRLAEQHNHLTVEQCELGIKVTLRGIASGISSGVRTEIRQFGSFNPVVYDPKMMRNPKTGDNIAAGYRGRTHFRPGKKLRERVDNLSA